MARGAHEEVLRLLMEIGGTDQVQDLSAALTALAESGEDGAAAAEKLGTQLIELRGAQLAAKAVVEFKAALVETDAQLEKAEQGLIALNREYSAADRSSKSVTSAFQRAAKAVDDLQQKQARQRLELERAQGALAKAGVDTNRLSSETDRLGDELQRTASELQRQGAAAQQSANRTDKAADAAQRSEAVFRRLQGVLLTVAAAFSFRELGGAVVDLLALGDAAERTERQFSRLFGGEGAGRQALSELRTLAGDLGVAFESTAAAGAKLKTFGIDPLNGSLEALINQNAAAGGTQQDLEGKILAVGQAWAKQKLQGEEILQLVERGIPVWDLLAKATGKNVPELQKLSEQGKLTRTEIGLLIEEIGKANQGAARDAILSLGAQFTVLRDQIRLLATDLSRGGPVDAVAGLLKDVNDRIKALATSPEFAEFRKGLAEAFKEGSAALNAFLSEGNLKALLGEITAFAAGVRDAFRVINSEEIQGFIRVLNLAQEPFNKLREAAYAGLGAVAELVDDSSKSVEGLTQETKELGSVVSLLDGLWDAATAGAEGFSQALDAERIRQANEDIKLLGVNAQNAGRAITVEGQKIVDALSRLADSAEISGAAFRNAFLNAIDSAQTVGEVDAMGAALKVAFDAGKVSATEYGVLAGKAAVKTLEIRNAADEAAGGFKVVGDAAEKESRRVIAALEAQRSAMAAQANVIARQLADALKAQGESSPQVSALEQQLKRVEGEIGQVTSAIETQEAALAKAGDTGTRSQQSVASAAKAAGEAAKAAGEQTQQSAEQSGTTMQALIDILGAFNAKWASVSENARLAFVESYNGAVRLSLTVTDVVDAMRRADEAVQRTVSAQRDVYQGMVGNLQALAETGTATGESLGAAFGASALELEAFAQAARRGQSTLDLLSQTDLDQLAAEAERAAQKVRSIEEGARAAVDQLTEMNRQLQDERDRLAGNEEEILRRKYEQERQRILELAQTAGAENQRVAAENLRLLEENHRRELELLRQRNEERRASGEGGGSAPSGGGGRAPGGAGAGGSGSGAGLPTAINVTVEGSVIGTDPARLADDLARLIATPLDRLRRRSL